MKTMPRKNWIHVFLCFALIAVSFGNAVQGQDRFDELTEGSLYSCLNDARLIKYLELEKSSSDLVNQNIESIDSLTSGFKQNSDLRPSDVAELHDLLSGFEQSIFESVDSSTHRKIVRVWGARIYALNDFTLLSVCGSPKFSSELSLTSVQKDKVGKVYVDWIARVIGVLEENDVPYSSRAQFLFLKREPTKIEIPDVLIEDLENMLDDDQRKRLNEIDLQFKWLKFGPRFFDEQGIANKLELTEAQLDKIDDWKIYIDQSNSPLRMMKASSSCRAILTDKQKRIFKSMFGNDFR